MSELSSQPTVIQPLYDWYRNGVLFVNRNYQRKLVWTLAEKQKLIDSILFQYPIPLILLAENKDEDESRYEILDGLQRLHTIFSFIEHNFTLSDGRCFDLKEFARAREVRDAGHIQEYPANITRIKRPEVSRLLGYTLPLSIMRNATPDEITDVFERINSYGHRLSEQERRQAGLLTPFASFVRKLSCTLRGDVSRDTIPLHSMPAISIDLPKTKYGYGLDADDIFWTRHGILRSTDLRDSADEQAIADIAASILSSSPIERSKSVLDQIYDAGSIEAKRVATRLTSYGDERLSREIIVCVDIIERIVNAGSTRSLRSLIFPARTTNPFSTLFAALVIATHDLSFSESMMLANPEKANAALNNSRARLNTGRDAVSVVERQKNIDTLKGLLRDCFVPAKQKKAAFGPALSIDFENAIRRSRIETPQFECKQGCLRLDAGRSLDTEVFDKVVNTICAIANIGPESEGGVFVGVADKEADADRILDLDKVKAHVINGRYVVGVDRELKALKKGHEDYFAMWRDSIENSGLSPPLKADTLSSVDLIDYRGMHVLWFRIPSQKGPSLCGDRCYARKGDQTVEVKGNEMVAVVEKFQRSRGRRKDQ